MTDLFGHLPYDITEGGDGSEAAGRQSPDLLQHTADTIREQVVEDKTFQTFASGTAVAAAAVSVGYALWMVRGSYLAASFLSSVPVWSLVDPLAGPFRSWSVWPTFFPNSLRIA